MMEAYCSKCKFTTYHEETGEDRCHVYLKCLKCGTKRTWSKIC